MDRARFDALAKLLASTGSRRKTFGALLGATFLGHQLEGEADAKGKGKGRGHNNGRGKGHSQGKGRGGGKGKNNRKHHTTKAQASPPARCFGSGACVPKKQANLAKCDFTGSNALENVNCTLCNLSDSSLLRADASGANFTKANLSRVCFVDADLSGATFSNTNTSGAIFCRTRMPNGSINNTGCTKSTKCCQTCIELGNACDSGIGGSCCGQGVCTSGVCTCPAPLLDCDGVCSECCHDGDCTGGDFCCNGVCKACCNDNDCGGATPNCCDGTCRACCNSGDCPPIECEAQFCINFECEIDGIAPDGTPCSVPGPGICCSGSCSVGSNCCENDDCSDDSNTCVTWDLRVRRHGRTMRRAQRDVLRHEPAGIVR